VYKTIFWNASNSSLELARIDAALKKAGLTEKAIEELEDSVLGDDPQQAHAAMIKIGGQIRDKPAFISEMVSIVEAINNEEGSVNKMAEGTLQNLKIDGDSARGEIVKGEDEREPIEFRKIHGGWLIEIPAESLE
jgi:hypothetical protein